METLENAIEKFHKAKGTVNDFKKIINTALFKMNSDALFGEPQNIGFLNNSFFYGLIFADFMLERADKEVRILAGNYLDTFIEPLKETYQRVINNFSKQTNDSFIRIILCDKEKGRKPHFLNDLEDAGVLKIIKARHKDPQHLSHFFCYDSKFMRIEKSHDRLNLETKDPIRAKVYLNNSNRTDFMVQQFDALWYHLW